MVPPAETNPFTPRDYSIIQRGLATAARALQACDRAEATGKDCSQSRADTELLRQQFEALKREYFPQQP